MKKAMLICGLLLSMAAQAYADNLNADEQRMVEWVDANADAAIALLEETVNISSGTMNHDGVRAVGDVMRRELDAVGLDTEWIDMSETNRAGHLFGRKLTGGGKRFLLIGHLDTVFEADDEFQAFERDGNLARGPGVQDMKGGNVVMVYALRALAEIGALEDIPIVLAYTGDEEKTGSPLAIARRDLIEAGKWADITLGFEAAITSDGHDWATIARRSSSDWTLEVTGRQAHSSGIFSDDVGAGAINEAARILNAFYEEARTEEEVTFNAGTIQGGTDVTYDPQENRGTTFGKVNVVPSKVVVHGGIRTLTQAQLDSTRDKMRDIVAASLPHTSATISFADRYPPMAPTGGNQRLQLALSDINEALGRGPMRTLDPLKRGAADISFVAPYSDGLAGMGPLGSGAHSPNEILELDSMALAIKRAALLIYRLSHSQDVSEALD
jgi:glutamate carboxypeptidase